MHKHTKYPQRKPKLDGPGKPARTATKTTHP